MNSLPISRRDMLVSVAMAALAGQASAEIITELQVGDPGQPAEQLEFDSSVLKSMLSGNKSSLEPKYSDFRERLLKEASSWVGKNRADNKEEISTLLRFFDLPFADKNGPVPFCAAGISYVAAMVYARKVYPTGEITTATLSNFVAEVERYHFYPTPNVRGIQLVGEAKANWVPAMTKDKGPAKPRRGWLVLFNWGGNQNHIGVVESVLKGRLQTIEFNTSAEGVAGSQRQGGAVARRNRDYPSKYVRGFVAV
ncbi:CHAP domain-containing protein [Variovorax gossypii]